MRLVRSAKGAGRVPAIEVLVSTAHIRDHIMNEEKTYMIRESHSRGDFSVRQCRLSINRCFTLVQSGLISLEEALHNASNPDEFRNARFWHCVGGPDREHHEP